MSVQSVDDRFLLVIGGDANCATGGPGNLCQSARPLTTVDIIDIRFGNRLISSAEHEIPQLNEPRQPPATSLWKKSGHGGDDGYVLHAVGGQTIDPDDEEDGTDVLATTEVLKFDRIKVVPEWPFRPFDRGQSTTDGAGLPQDVKIDEDHTPVGRLHRPLAFEPEALQQLDGEIEVDLDARDADGRGLRPKEARPDGHSNQNAVDIDRNVETIVQ
jgi:hypothetical protein